jgi:hypothetical protein
MALSFAEQEEQKEKFLSELYAEKQTEIKRKKNVDKILQEEGISSEKKASRQKIYDDYVKGELEKSPSLGDNSAMVSHLFLTGMDRFNEAEELKKKETGKTSETETDGKTQTETGKPQTPSTTTKTEAPKDDIEKSLDIAYDAMTPIQKQSFDNMIELYGQSQYKRKK